MRRVLAISLHILGWLSGGLILYMIVKPYIKALIQDTYSLPITPYHDAEFFTFNLYLVTLAILGLITGIVATHVNRAKYQVQNQIETDTYGNFDLRKIKSGIFADIKKNLDRDADTFYEITRSYPKNIYVIDGGWRAGKTSAAGMLLSLLSNDEKVGEVVSIYHDTFNFGNIDESISSFFKKLSEVTQINDFKKLGKVSSPGVDMGFSLGPLNITIPFFNNYNTSLMRARIYDRLTKSKQRHVVIIDDIDRLTFEEQLQWLRTLELLGKFNHKLIIIVPVKVAEIVKNLELNHISQKYLEKILPNRYNVGVDLDFIKKKFNLNKEGKGEQHRERQYYKYIVSLALRGLAQGIADNGGSSSGGWRVMLIENRISAIASHIWRFAIKLSNGTQNGVGIGPYTYGNQQQIYLSNGDTLNKLHILRVAASNYQQWTKAGEHSPGQSDIDYLLSIDRVNSMFGKLAIAQRTTNNPPSPNDPSAYTGDFWVDIAPTILEDLTSDPLISNIIHYEEAIKEIETLKAAADEAEERLIIVKQIFSQK